MPATTCCGHGGSGREGPGNGRRPARRGAFGGSELPAGAQAPTREEQFIYAVIAWNGKDYSSTFVREPSTDLYLLADTDSFLSARKVFVYYWPITHSFRLDPDNLNRRLAGTLHIAGGGAERRLEEKVFTYYNLRGEYELNWKVAEGPDADAVTRDYQVLVSQFSAAQAAYQEAVASYTQRANDLAAKIAALRARGADASGPQAELQHLSPPEAPAPSQKYAAPPAAIQRAFIVNLPAGTYRLWFESPDGTIMQGSEKRLLVIPPGTGGTVGYEVIPGDRWTRPETSRFPRSVLYANGSADLYLRPFFESAFNDFLYNKVVDNDGTGNRSLSQWVRLQQVPRASIVVADSAGTHPVSEQSFAVEQTTGQALGYTIVPWEQHAHRSSEKPDLIAFHLSITAGRKAFHVNVRDSSGAALPGSDREGRIIDGPGQEAVLVMIMLLPAFCALLILLLRARWYALNRRPPRHTVS